MKKLLAAFALCLLYVGHADARLAARTYYVSASGNNSNTGMDASSANAWADCTNVGTKQFNPGDNILFNGGTTFSCGMTVGANFRGNGHALVTIGSYNGTRATIGSGTSGGFYGINNGGLQFANLNFTGNATGSNTATGVQEDIYNLGVARLLDTFILQNVSINQYGYDGLLVDDYSTAVGSGFNNVQLLTVDASYNTVGSTEDTGAGIVIVGYGGDGIGSNIGSGFTPSFTNVLLDHVSANYNLGNTSVNDNWTGSGIALSEAGSYTIQNSVANYNGANNNYSEAGPSGIIIFDASNGTVQMSEAAYNTTGAGSQDGDGIDFDMGVTNSIGQYNWTHNNAHYGLMLWSYSSGSLVANNNNTYRFNLSQNDGVGAYVGSDGAVATTNAYYYNNTIYTSGSLIAFQLDGINSITGHANNNVIYSGSSTAWLLNTTIFNPSGFSFQGNDYYSVGTVKFKWSGTQYSSMSAWQTATGQEKISGSNVGLISNPSLTSPGTGGTTNGYNPSMLTAYLLQAGSPMIGTGQNLSTLISVNLTGLQDYYGNAAIGPSGYDLGAHSK